MKPHQLTPAESALIQRARLLARRYRESVADLVAVIAECDRARLYAVAGHPSLFDFCVKQLLLSEDEAYKLIRSARAARERPEILSFLSEGSLTARTIALLAPESSRPDFVDLLDQAKGQTAREVEKLVAALNPAQPLRDQVRLIGAVAGPATAGAPPAAVYRFAFSADETLKSLLESAKGLLRHRHPAGRLEDVLRDALEALLSAIDPLRRPPAGPGRAHSGLSRKIPRSTRDAVWRRDGGRCTFISPDGARCSSTSWIELDHIQPWSLGGVSDQANLRILCRAHNQSEARRLFGSRNDV